MIMSLVEEHATGYRRFVKTVASKNDGVTERCSTPVSTPPGSSTSSAAFGVTSKRRSCRSKRSRQAHATSKISLLAEVARNCVELRGARRASL